MAAQITVISVVARQPGYWSYAPRFYHVYCKKCATPDPALVFVATGRTYEYDVDSQNTGIVDIPCESCGGELSTLVDYVEVSASSVVESAPVRIF